MAETKQKAKKERVMVFIDGSNLYHVLNQHFSRNDIKFGKFAEKLAGDRNQSELITTILSRTKKEGDLKIKKNSSLLCMTFLI